MALGLPDDPAQQRKLLIGALPLLLVGAYVYFLHGNYTAELDALETRLENLQTNIDLTRMRATRSGRLEDELAQLERLMGRLEELVPQSDEVPQLLSQLTQEANNIGVELAGMEPGVTDIGTHYNRRTFEIVIYGSYHRIATFLAEVASLPRIIKPIDLQLQPRQQEVDRTGAQRLEALFQIETYVQPERAAPSPTAQTASASAGA